MKVIVPLHPSNLTSESLAVDEDGKVEETEDTNTPEKDEPEDDEDETSL